MFQQVFRSSVGMPALLISRSSMPNHAHTHAVQTKPVAPGHDSNSRRLRKRLHLCPTHNQPACALFPIHLAAKAGCQPTGRLKRRSSGCWSRKVCLSMSMAGCATAGRRHTSTTRRPHSLRRLLTLNAKTTCGPPKVWTHTSANISHGLGTTFASQVERNWLAAECC